MQKRTLRNIAGVNKFHPCKDLFKKYKLLTVPRIYIYEKFNFVNEVLIPGILGPEILRILVLETWMELEPLV